MVGGLSISSNVPLSSHLCLIQARMMVYKKIVDAMKEVLMKFNANTPLALKFAEDMWTTMDKLKKISSKI